MCSDCVALSVEILDEQQTAPDDETSCFGVCWLTTSTTWWSVPSVTDEELRRIGERADYYPFSSEDAMRHGGEGTTRAVSLAAVDVLEGASRELRRRDGERDPGVEERALRRLDIPFVPVRNRHLVD